MLNKKSLPTIISICLLATSLFLISGCDDESEQLPMYRVKGPLKVSYEIETAFSGSMSTSTPIEALEILMFEEYVIVKSKNGSSQFFPVDKIKQLCWSGN